MTITSETSREMSVASQTSRRIFQERKKNGKSSKASAARKYQDDRLSE